MASRKMKALIALAAAPAFVRCSDMTSPPFNASTESRPNATSNLSNITSIITTQDSVTEMPATTDLPSATNTTYPPAFASATTCLSSWSSWNDAVGAYTSESYGTWSIVTPAATLTGHVYYTTPAPSTYSAPPCPFDYADICQSLQGYSIIASEPTTFVVPATTDFLSGLIPASVLVATPACAVGAPACSALLSAGLVLFYDGDVVDWRNCQMTPPGIGPVALTPTDFLVVPPTAAPTTTSSSSSSSPTSHPAKPTPSATALPQPTINYLIPAPALLATDPATTTTTTTTIAPSHLSPPSPSPQISTLTLIVAPASASPYTTRIALPPPPSTPLATVAGQTVVFDPARDAAAVFVGAFPIKAGGPAVAVGGTRVALRVGGALVVGGKTVAVAAVPTAEVVATVEGVAVWREGGKVVVGGVAVREGGGVVTVGGVGFGVGADGGSGGGEARDGDGGLVAQEENVYPGLVVVGGKTYSAAPGTAGPAVAVVGGHTLTGSVEYLNTVLHIGHEVLALKSQLKVFLAPLPHQVEAMKAEYVPQGFKC
ncbi:hypothetical protein SLS56_003789 [Neofusicoccum ribis]|uniref:Uncharacterized protein n=1 Tax=Neofusicoccum ribis TaxID=45134 RepID=A0ABR3SYG8_9PEZI